MNKLVISGNLVRDIDLQFTPGSGLAKIKNTVATRRKIKNKATGKYDSDFIPIVAFGKSAEFIANNFEKGQGIIVEARMQSGSYDNKEGIKVYTLEAIVENVEFLGGKKDNSAPQNDTFGGGNFEEDITPVDDGDMPF
jgi:single-strand DNA-binding protein